MTTVVLNKDDLLPENITFSPLVAVGKENLYTTNILYNEKPLYLQVNEVYVSEINDYNVHLSLPGELQEVHNTIRTRLAECSASLFKRTFTEEQLQKSESNSLNYSDDQVSGEFDKENIYVFDQNQNNLYLPQVGNADAILTASIHFVRTSWSVDWKLNQLRQENKTSSIEYLFRDAEIDQGYESDEEHTNENEDEVLPEELVFEPFGDQ